MIKKNENRGRKILSLESIKSYSISIRFSLDEFEKITEEAKNKKRTFSDMIRVIISDYFEKKLDF